MITLIIIFSCGVAGSLIRALWGWLNSGDSFVARKFASTMIAAVFVALPISVGVVSTNISADSNSLLITGVLTLMAGWGVDDGLKQLSTMQSAVAKPKNSTTTTPGSSQ